MPEIPIRIVQNARAIAAAALRLPTQHPILLIDGPSGAGKSSTADAVVAFWPGEPPVLVRMDDIYPGWGGLARAGEHVEQHLLGPLSRGVRGHWQRYDWHAGHLAEWHEVGPDRALLIEGCGVLTRGNAPLSHLNVWLDGEPHTRKRRALERDRGGFDDHWDEWSEQVDEFIAKHDPVASADLVLWSDR
ncbi:ATP-binding protein [Paramicrobacterium agarici]|uniref:Uridine kinase n=1 Tax=Paramicrobacterium agarici TaxID=630514 RepID=A0A2A9DZD0_9MICO|nr:ATP-binding protein [Microbacterium agarici]PFG31485.1 uridine kinase [Microbacterium agarici]TQO21373.1 uridine kinase [Microbacterium agarici]